MKCPSGKIRYRTKLSAWKASLKFSDKYILQRPYKCKMCHGRHLSTKERTTKGSVMPYKIGLKLNKKYKSLLII